MKWKWEKRIVWWKWNAVFVCELKKSEGRKKKEEDWQVEYGSTVNYCSCCFTYFISLCFTPLHTTHPHFTHSHFPERKPLTPGKKQAGQSQVEPRGNPIVPPSHHITDNIWFSSTFYRISASATFGTWIIHTEKVFKLHYYIQSKVRFFMRIYYM